MGHVIIREWGEGCGGGGVGWQVLRPGWGSNWWDGIGQAADRITAHQFKFQAHSLLAHRIPCTDHTEVEKVRQFKNCKVILPFL